MTLDRAPKIERYEVVTVESQEQNQYGDLIFSDAEGKPYRIGNKRPHLFDQIQEGRAVKLGYAIYKGREYIVSAKLYDGNVSPPQTEPVHTQAKPVEAKVTPSSGYNSDGAARGMLVKEIGDMIRAEKLSPIFGKVAPALITWYRTQVFGVSKVEHDGKDLPKF